MCINKGVKIFSLWYCIEYRCFASFGPIQHSIALVVMETKVSTLVIWLFWTFIEVIRLNLVLVSTKLIWTLVNIIAMHIYKIFCKRQSPRHTYNLHSPYLHWRSPNNSSYLRRKTSTSIEILIICIKDENKCFKVDSKWYQSQIPGFIA